MTLRLSSACSNQLSYTPSAQGAICKFIISNLKPGAGRRLVELRRFELLTYSLQSYRSTN